MVQRRRRRASGRRKLKVLSLAEQASDSRLAADLGMHPDTVQKIRSKEARGRPLMRYALEQAGVVPLEARSPLKEMVFAWCHKNGIRSLLEVADKMAVGITTLHAALERGSATRPTLEKLAAVMGCRPEDLAALCDSQRHRSPHKLASILFNVNVRDGRQPDVDGIAARVTQEFPDADHRRIRRYLEGRERKMRGRGRPRRYTDAEAVEVRRLRDDEDLSWAKIGILVGWPVKRNRDGHPCDCTRARRAYAHALTLSP